MLTEIIELQIDEIVETNKDLAKVSFDVSNAQ